MPYPNALAGLFGLPDNNAQPDTSGGLFGAAKRQVTGLLSDPVGNAKQTLGLLGQQISRQNALMDAAFSDPKNPLQITNRNALAEAANNMLTGPLGFAPVGMTVWHGSPHTFNKFDSSKIGTGEGAQVYGHGMYVAESPQVAKQYQEQLSRDVFALPDGRLFNPDTLQHVNVRSLARRGDLDQAIGKAAAIAADTSSPVAALARQDLQTLQALKAQGGIGPTKGNLYKADLADEAIPKMLDWDKPLAQQSENVRKALDAFKQTRAARSAERSYGQPLDTMAGKYGEPRGEDLHSWMYEGFAGKSGGEAARVAEFLRRNGVPGIRYLDQSSRVIGDFKITPPSATVSGKWMLKGSDPNSAGMHFDSEAQALARLAELNAQRTSNFVVFPKNDGLLTILERNGLPVR